MAVLGPRGVTKQSDDLTAVSEADPRIEKNQTYSLIGPNGVGKIVVLNITAGVCQMAKGNILFEDRSVYGCAPYKIVEMGIARTYQNVRLSRKMTATENVMTGFHCRGRVGLLNIVYNRRRILEGDRTIRKKSEELLEYLRIANLKDEPASSLPCGHQRLLEIARAVAIQPRILLLDEPAACMNAQEKEDPVSTIRRIRKDFDMPVLIVEHSTDLIMSTSDDTTVLDYGTGIVCGAPEEIRNNEEVIEVYPGRSDS